MKFRNVDHHFLQSPILKDKVSSSKNRRIKHGIFGMKPYSLKRHRSFFDSFLLFFSICDRKISLNFQVIANLPSFYQKDVRPLLLQHIGIYQLRSETVALPTYSCVNPTSRHIHPNALKQQNSRRVLQATEHLLNSVNHISVYETSCSPL